MQLNHLTRVFPKLKMNPGESVSNLQILERGFDVKITDDIKTKLAGLAVGDYLTVYPSTHRETGMLEGLNIKVKSIISE